jgi:type IV secretion system protein VirB1
LDHGYNIDLGLGQINSANLSRVGLTVEEIFDPCKNIQAAGAIYHENLTRAGSRYTGEAAVKAALSAYNTGDFQNGFRNGYVRKVLANRETLADSQPVAVQPIPLIEPTEKRHRTRVRPTAEQPADQSQQTPPVAKPKAEEEDSSIPNKTSAVLVYSRPLDGPNEDSVLVYSRVSQKSSANPP